MNKQEIKEDLKVQLKLMKKLFKEMDKTSGQVTKLAEFNEISSKMDFLHMAINLLELSIKMIGKI